MYIHSIDLKDSTFYLFKVKAVNKYGHSAWSKPIDSITNSYLYSSNGIEIQICVNMHYNF